MLRARARSIFSSAVAAALIVGLLGTGSPAAAATAPVEIGELRVNAGAERLGIPVEAPTFGWQLASEARDVVQQAYRIRVAEHGSSLADDAVWASGWIDSSNSVQVPYDGPALEPTTRYEWQVQIRDGAGAESEWSTPDWFETALAADHEWEGAAWIGAPEPEPWTDAVVEVEATMAPGTAFGVFFRTIGGNGYMWQLNDELPDTPRLRPHVRTNGAYQALPDVPIGSLVGAGVFDSRVALRIEAAGTSLRTFVNDVLVDERTDAAFGEGRIGFRTSGAEAATIHAVRVTDGDEDLLSVDLATEASPFSGGTPLRGEGLRVSGTQDVFLADPTASPALRTEFDVDRPLASARLYATARGVYEFSVNGERVGDFELAPGWTDYNIRHSYQSYDLTEQLHQGANAVGVLAGPGWYSGALAWFGPEQYGARPSVLGTIRLEYADGEVEWISTDDTWVSGVSPIRSSDLLHGEQYDARLEQAGWDRPGFDDTAWAPAAADEDTTGIVLEPQPDPPVRVVEELTARSMSEPQPGVYVYDLGQNMVGRARIEVPALAGETVQIRHAEVTHPDGRIAPENLRSARATDTVTVAEDGVLVYEPRFTFHGFRYVELSGLSTPPGLDTVVGRVIHTDGALTSRLTTSDPMVNQLQSNITWGQRGNFLSIPTDTPARDERLGWTGDINVFASTATFNMDTQSFFTKWMTDMRDAQLPNGAYPEVAPQFCKDPAVHPSCGGGSTGWADAGVTVPWTVWRSYGDTRVIDENWESMTEYLDFMDDIAPSGIRPDAGSWGDWLSHNDPTPGNVIGTIFYARSADLMAEMAEATGRSAEAASYRDLFERIADAFADEFIAADGTITGNSQTAYVTSVAFGLVPDALLEAVGDKLYAAVERRGFHLSTGFLGTPYLLPALTETGNVDIAYRLLLNRTYPSWGFQIDRGATTMWERWDSIREDGSFGDLGMNSFNHFAYGAVGDWMYKTIGGIEALEPGYASTLIAPQPGGGLTFADVEYDSIRGTIGSSWRQGAAGFELDVDVPANTTAVVSLPASSAGAVLESGIPAGDAEGVHDVSRSGDRVLVEVGSGSYSFLVDATLAGFDEVIAAAEALGDDVETAVDAGDLGEDDAAAARAGLAALIDAVEAARAAYTGTGAIESARDIHTALADAHEVSRSVADARDLAAAADALVGSLSELSAALLGVDAAIAASEEPVLPGTRTTLTGQVTAGSAAIDDVRFAAEPRRGWTTEPAEAVLGDLAEGAAGSATIDATVGMREAPGPVGIAGTVSYGFEGSRAVLPRTATLEIGAALRIVEVALEPATVRAGDALTVQLTVANDNAFEVVAAPRAMLADGVPRHGPEGAFAPGETTTLSFEVDVPLNATAGTAELSAALVSGDVVYAEDSVSYTVELPDLGVVDFDHVDLGDATSEAAHGLTASAQSGTAPNEAGLTRRYTTRTDPQGFFEVTMAVQEGEPFALNVLETFDGNRLKDYRILVDGVLVHEHLHQRVGGAGSAAYTIVVDDPAVITDNGGDVRVRFENNAKAANYDPSIADLWTQSMHDHVDLGDSGSETVHGLTATSRSGTNVEAGATRRYANREDPEGAFEFDLAVIPGQSFVVRAVETYGTSQIKEYDVFVDDVLVHERLYQHTGGNALIEYQFVVGAEHAAADGRVRIRFQNNEFGRNYDASLADVWALPIEADAAAPRVTTQTISDQPRRNGWYRSEVAVRVDGSDDRGRPVALEVNDGSGWAPYTAPVPVAGDGTHTITARGTDEAANRSAEVAAEVRIDGTAPVATHAVIGAEANGWLAPGAQLTFAAEDALSGVDAIEFRFGGGEWTSYRTPIVLPNGVSSAEYRARDLAGNTSEPVAVQLRVDADAPVVAVTRSTPPAASGWHLDHPALAIEAGDDASGVASVRYAIGAGQWQDYAGPFEVGDGVTEVRVRVTDGSGNTTTVTETVRVDTIAPEALAQIDGRRVLTVSGADEHSGVALLEFSLDGGETWSAYEAPVQLGLASAVIAARATDHAGHVGTSGEHRIAGGSLSADWVVQGGTLTVRGEGFEPGEQVRVELHSAPVLLDRVVARGDGTFETTVTIPAGTSVGAHEIVLVGEASARDVRFALEVAAAGSIPPIAQTGLAIGMPVLLAMLALGLGAVFVTRRRRTATEPEV
ncbi:family 78 glycoside hydrolase catalytic domain [Agromyces silvae]|uniref:family 78 glycoside hydrolase catalytic domain n=1 Tax=Agromyces silvae TaxID=3388266 RepID=UPI00280ADC19|nr:family 78 glycoside hydrolase catalytic domain [Agromyces protaetiae]